MYLGEAVEAGSEVVPVAEEGAGSVAAEEDPAVDAAVAVAGPQELNHELTNSY